MPTIDGATPDFPLSATTTKGPPSRRSPEPRAGGLNGYEVMPRYSSGSPAWVDGRTAERVAAQEREMIRAALDGLYGPEQKERAAKDGLEGIVVYRERDSGPWLDLITGRNYGDMPYQAIRYPQRLFWVRGKRSRGTYYCYGRQVIATCSRKQAEEFNAVKVINRLAEVTCLNPFGSEIATLWRERQETRL